MTMRPLEVESLSCRRTPDPRPHTAGQCSPTVDRKRTPHDHHDDGVRVPLYGCKREISRSWCRGFTDQILFDPTLVKSLPTWSDVMALTLAIVWPSNKRSGLS